MTLANEILTPLYLKLQRAFPLREIRSQTELDDATKILDKHFRDSYEDAGEEAYIFALSSIVAAFEEKLEASQPEATGLDMVKFMMDQFDMNQTELGKVLGISQGTVSQILNGTRKVTADHARALGKRFNRDPGLFL